jgi:ribonuclease HI
MTIYTDGLAEPNPGHATFAWIAFDDEGGEIASASGYIGPNSTNNTAEYYAVGYVLSWLQVNHGQRDVVIYSDSKLVLNQISGEWGCHVEHLAKLRDRCRVLLDGLFGLKVELRWVPSLENKADGLTRTAYKDQLGRLPPVRVRRNRRAA